MTRHLDECAGTRMLPVVVAVVGVVAIAGGGGRLEMVACSTRQQLVEDHLFITSQQCSGSMTFWGGSGSADPCLWLMDPDHAIFVIDLQDASKKLIFNTIFSAYYFLKVHLHNFSKIKSQKESQNRRNQGFSYYFCMMIEGSGSISLTSGSGSGRP